ncbi:hypothetical protein Hypma_000362 [Hypsizygus marmoreus]|uniref:F-box domain-containing protein n=1 Tax=Hypsizygus marmoreus TaxID=39966 RepID=A0A369JD60_HYPMA|nr:hypothetical protein Hypma_000362 [Hypsizygus marmoreus]
MSLLQLQDDLLLHVFQALQQRELYALALLCRRLNHLSLTLFLERENILDVTSAIDIKIRPGQSLDALSALRIALFVSSISDLSFHFYHMLHPAFLHGINRLVGLISRLSQVRKLTLTISNSAPEATDPAYKQLCQVLTSKSCLRFTIVDSRGDIRVYAPGANPGSKTNSLRRVRSAVQGIIGPTKAHLSLKRSPSSIRLTPQDEKASPFPFVLSSFVIHAPHSLSYTRLPRTLSSLKTATSLTLACLEISEAGWTYFLSQLSSTCHELTSLEVHSREIGPCDLLRFINRLPKLTNLSVHGPSRESPSGHIRTRPTLPLLTGLSASPEYASFLLAINRAMPKLRSLDIMLSSWHDISSTSCDEHISNIMQYLDRRASHISPTLVIDFNVDLMWMKDGMVENLDRLSGRFLGPGPSSFTLFTKLTIVGSAPLDLSDHDLRSLVLPRWLRFFKTLRHLTFTRDEADQPVQRLYPLFHSIHMHCPNIETISIGDQPRDVLDILATFEAFISEGASKSFSLMEFPEDILYLIFANLHSKDLYALANLSRYLRVLVMPIYLRRRGIREPSIFTQLRISDDSSFAITDISALMLSSHLQSIDHLSCIVSRTVSHFLAFEFLDRLRRLVVKLSAIGKLTVDFRGFATEQSRPTVLDREWVRLVTAILDEVVQRSCASVTILGGSSFQRSLGDLEHRRSGQEGPEECPRWGFSHGSAASKIQPQVYEIESETLRIPALLDWMKTSFSSNKFTHLKISRLTRVVGPVLPVIADSLLNLTDLQMAGNTILPHHVLDFVSKLPKLTSLSLDSTLSSKVEDKEVSGRIPRLQRLRYLSAPKDYANFLLLCMDPLPDLERLTLSLPRVHPFLATNYLNTPPRAIAHLRACDKLPTICLSIALDWALHLGQQDTRDIGWNTFSSAVTEMTLTDVFCPSQPDPLKDLPAWLEFFPNLRHLSCSGPCSIGDIASSSQNILRAFPSLSTFGLNGNQHERSWWMETYPAV